MHFPIRPKRLVRAFLALSGALSLSAGLATAAPVSIDDLAGLSFEDAIVQVDITGNGTSNIQFVIGDFGIGEDAAVAVTVNSADGNIFATTEFTTTGVLSPSAVFNAQLFDAGAVVDGTNSLNSSVLLYNGPDGPLTSTTQYLGFRTTVGEVTNLGFASQAFVPGTVSEYFGWFGLSRGSLTFVDAFVGPANTAVTTGGDAVSAVPLPAGVWFLLAGLGGLASLRRQA